MMEEILFIDNVPNCGNKINDKVELLKITDSDINEHLDTLSKLSSECDIVTEFGTRWVVSTWALLKGKPKKLTTYDIVDNYKDKINEILEVSKEYDLNFEFIIDDVLKINIENTDLLFIDTLHIYRQLYSELIKHSKNVNKYIVMHDTTLYGNKDEIIYDHASEIIKNSLNEKNGLCQAIDDFLLTEDGEKWEIHKKFTNNNGLTILKRKPLKVIILVLSNKVEPYISMTNTIRETWASELSDNIEIFYYFGNSDELRVVGDEIFCPFEDTYTNMGYKTISSFQWLLENKKFDYIFRTNASSYVNQKKLYEFIDNKPKYNFYCGIIPFEHLKFCSGCGYFLSRDLVKLVVENRDIWDHNLIDDVALAKLLSMFSVPLNDKAKRFDIDKYDDNDEIDLSHYHYRCKCDDRNDDMKIMKKIHKKFLL